VSSGKNTDCALLRNPSNAQYLGRGVEARRYVRSSPAAISTILDDTLPRHPPVGHDALGNLVVALLRNQRVFCLGKLSLYRCDASHDWVVERRDRIRTMTTRPRIKKIAAIIAYPRNSKQYPARMA
jgi:hypothetical protein